MLLICPIKHFKITIGPVPLDPEREEELPARQVPQLASRAQRLSDDVHGPQDRQARQVHERPRGEIQG